MRNATIKVPPLLEKYKRKLLSNLKKNTKTGCLEWQKSRGTGGYGQITIQAVKYKAHRVAFIIANGEIPKSKPLILHKCDNPPCCNPKHLFAGTDEDNTRDKIEKGRANSPKGDNHYARIDPSRTARGERHGSKTKPERVACGERVGLSKLTEAKVKKIRKRHAQGDIYPITLGAMFGVDRKTICRVIERKTWRHVS